MTREIERLDLTQNQYSVLGTIMMVLCLALSAGVFFLADVSIAVGIVIAVVSVEFGFVGYLFRKVAGELSLCDDPEIISRHRVSAKSRRNTVTVSMFTTLMFLVCVLCVIIVVDFKPPTVSQAVETKVPVTQSVEQTQQELSQESEIDVLPQTQPEIVFATQTGKRYHFSQNCAGKNSFAITMQEALNHSLTPCQNCAKE